MSGRADANVQDHGETVTHEYVTDFSVDTNGQVTDVQKTQDDIQAIVSQPSEEDERRLEGRLETGSLKLTVASDVDVSADRDGHEDHIYRDGQEYKVQEVVDDEHPFTGTRKLSVFVDRVGGRGN